MEKKKLTYKQALSELESIVAKIENQPPDIDELAAMVKKAADLVKFCKDKLRETGKELDKNLGDLE